MRALSGSLRSQYVKRGHSTPTIPKAEKASPKASRGDAAGPPRPFPREPQRRWAFAWAERAMQNPLFGRLEHWEMDRKVRKFGMMQQERAASSNGRQEIAFGEDCCKGHLDYHGARTMRAFQTRVLALKEALA